MTVKKIFRFALFLVAACSTVAWGGDVVDRIVATVNGHAILQSDWDQEVAYEAFVDGRPLNTLTTEQKKAALDRLIDRELVREQVEHAGVEHATSDEIEQRLAKIRKFYSYPASWHTALRNYNLNEAELRDQVTAELEEMHAVDSRLRPGIQVDSRSVEAYYRDKLLPELRQSGAAEVPLEQVAPKIRELLAQEKMNDLLAVWIRTLRFESDIRVPSTPTGRGGGGK